MKTAVTLSLLSEAINGPFLFHGDLVAACQAAKSLGFHGIELFAPGPDAVPTRELNKILTDHGLELAAVGTGAGWLLRKLTLTSPDASTRREAIDFIASMTDYAASLGAPVIIGSMQGRWGDGVSRERSLEFLADALTELNHRAPGRLLYEPLNRYETNLFNRLAESAEFLDSIALPDVKLLADLFHMNIEEANLREAILQTGPRIGHVHIADSNRGPAGWGHTEFATIGSALWRIGFDGFVSAEAFPKIDSVRAAEMTMMVLQRDFRCPQ